MTGPAWNTRARPASTTGAIDFLELASRLTKAGRSRLSRMLRPLIVPAGGGLLEPGQRCDSLFLVARGNIRVYQVSRCGREIALYRVSEGEPCPLSVACLLGRVPFPATAVATEVTECLVVSSSDFQSLFDEEPGLRRYVMELQANRLADLAALVVEVAFDRVDRRLAGFLLEHVAQDRDRAVDVSWTHEEIAAEIGSVREVVTRALDSFETEGLVELGRRRIRVRDIDRLRARRAKSLGAVRRTGLDPV